MVETITKISRASVLTLVGAVAGVIGVQLWHSKSTTASEHLATSQDLEKTDKIACLNETQEGATDKIYFVSCGGFF